MKKIALMLVVLVAAMLVGCTPTIVHDTKTVYIAPPKALMKPCDVAEPMDPGVYVTAGWGLKEEMQTKLNRQQLANLNVCNKRIGRLQEWADRTNAVFDTDTPAPSAAVTGAPSGS